MKPIASMQIGEVGYLSTKAVYWLAYWHIYCILKDALVYTERNPGATTKIKRTAQGWELLIPAGESAELMPIPDPPQDMFIRGHGIIVKAID